MPYADKTLAQIVTEFPASATLLEKHDLDYCCGGKQTLKIACTNETKLKTLEEELSMLLANHRVNSSAVDFDSMPTQILIEYIIGKHHSYVKESLPVILGHLQKVASKHGSRHAELLEIFSLFSQVSEEMLSHMQKEEKILFPAMLEVLKSKDLGTELPDASRLLGPMQVMELEHETVGDLLASIRKLSNRYSPPADACMTYKLSFDELKEFEEDLHRHVHLENNILFPQFKNYL